MASNFKDTKNQFSEKIQELNSYSITNSDNINKTSYSYKFNELFSDIESKRNSVKENLELLSNKRIDIYKSLINLFVSEYYIERAIQDFSYASESFDLISELNASNEDSSFINSLKNYRDFISYKIEESDKINYQNISDETIKDNLKVYFERFDSVFNSLKNYYSLNGLSNKSSKVFYDKSMGKFTNCDNTIKLYFTEGTSISVDESGNADEKSFISNSNSFSLKLLKLSGIIENFNYSISLDLTKSSTENVFTGETDIIYNIDTSEYSYISDNGKISVSAEFKFNKNEISEIDISIKKIVSETTTDISSFILTRVLPDSDSNQTANFKNSINNEILINDKYRLFYYLWNLPSVENLNIERSCLDEISNISLLSEYLSVIIESLYSSAGFYLNKSADFLYSDYFLIFSRKNTETNSEESYLDELSGNLLTLGNSLSLYKTLDSISYKEFEEQGMKEQLEESFSFIKKQNLTLIQNFILSEKKIKKFIENYGIIVDFNNDQTSVISELNSILDLILNDLNISNDIISFSGTNFYKLPSFLRNFNDWKSEFEKYISSDNYDLVLIYLGLELGFNANGKSFETKDDFSLIIADMVNEILSSLSLKNLVAKDLINYNGKYLSSILLDKYNFCLQNRIRIDDDFNLGTIPSEALIIFPNLSILNYIDLYIPSTFSKSESLYQNFYKKFKFLLLKGILKEKSESIIKKLIELSELLNNVSELSFRGLFFLKAFSDICTLFKSAVSSQYSNLFLYKNSNIDNIITDYLYYWKILYNNDDFYCNFIENIDFKEFIENPDKLADYKDLENIYNGEIYKTIATNIKIVKDKLNE